MIDLKKISQSKHIAILSANSDFTLANALYSFILSLHKKVSLTAVDVDKKYDFLPWYSKVRPQVPSSCDLELSIDFDTVGLYKFFVENSIKINSKMATSLYAALLIEDEQQTLFCESEKLLVMSELIKLGAEAQICYHSLREKRSLALFRLKSHIFANFLLKDDAKTAEVYFDKQVLKQTGACDKDAESIAKELLTLIHVEKVLLIDKDQNKILTEIKG